MGSEWVVSDLFSFFFLVFKLQTPQASGLVGDHQHSKIHSKPPGSFVSNCLACSTLLCTTAIDEDSTRSRIQVPLSGCSECTHRIQSILLIDFEQSPLLMCQRTRLAKNCQGLPFLASAKRAKTMRSFCAVRPFTIVASLTSLTIHQHQGQRFNDL